jgi:large subunit ribosomal protein L13
MKTYSAKPTEVNRKWYEIDASEASLGRLSTKVAELLTGKSKPMYTAHIDCGDYVIITNSDNLVVTGDKKLKKTYYKHSGFPGGIKDASLQEMLDKDSREVIIKSVKGMLPVNKLRANRLLRLKVYADNQHNHSAQSPGKISLKEGK